MLRSFVRRFRTIRKGDSIIAGTLAGGQKTAQTNKELHGEDFYRNIGKIGAVKYRERQEQGIAKPRGFAYNRELARTAGKLGGEISKRTSKK